MVTGLQWQARCSSSLRKVQVMARRKKARSGGRRKQSCGHTKAKAKSLSKKAHKAGRKAHIKRSASNKGWCVVRGGKRK